MVSHIVKMAEFKIAKGSFTLKTNSLGSCVGILLYDEWTKIGGMAHVMLPKAPEGETLEVGRYANLAIPQLYQDMIRLGANKYHMRAMIFGGANMFFSSKEKSILEIGLHNIHMAKRILEQYEIPILFEDIGGKKGRSVELHGETGHVFVQDFLQEKQQLSFVSM